MGDDGSVSHDPAPVDPLIAHRRTTTLTDPPADVTLQFGRFEDAPEPVAAWQRTPTPAPAPRPGLLAVAAVLATVATIWGIAVLRPAPSRAPRATTPTTEPAVLVAELVSQQHRDGATTVELSLANTGTEEAALSNHVWVVRQGEAFPDAIAAVGCLAADDLVAKQLPRAVAVTARTDGSARECGLGSFVLAPGTLGRLTVTVAGLAPGDHRVLATTATSPVFTVP
jgi:hypothetical protein